MTREEKIKILMEDRCTEREAKQRVDRDYVIIWENPNEWIQNLKECDCYNGETIEDVRNGKVADTSFVNGYVVEYIL